MNRFFNMDNKFFVFMGRSRPASSEFSVHPLLHSGCHRRRLHNSSLLCHTKDGKRRGILYCPQLFPLLQTELQTGDHHQYHHAPHRCCSVYRSSDRQSRKRSYVQRTFQSVHCICTDLCDDPSVHLSDPFQIF